MTILIITNDFKIGVHPEEKELPKPRFTKQDLANLPVGAMLPIEPNAPYESAMKQWENEIVFFEDQKYIRIWLPAEAYVQCTTELKPGIYSCEIPPFEVVSVPDHPEVEHTSYPPYSRKARFK